MSRRYDKTVRIPVHVKDGRLEFLYEKEMPQLAKGAIGEVIFEDWVLKDARWKAPLNQEKTVLVAEAGTPLAFGVQPDKFPTSLYEWRMTKADMEPELRKKAGGIFADEPCDRDRKWWIGGQLLEPLSLTLRGERSARLSGGKCLVFALNELKKQSEAISPNQALTFVSQTFEPERQSFAGNIFRSGLLFWRGEWRTFETVRKTLEFEAEPERFKSTKSGEETLFPSEK